MSAMTLQLLGLCLLVFGSLGLELLLQNHTPIAGAMREARGLAVLTAVGGIVGATAWWGNQPQAFAWTLPPLAARYLAVAGIAFGLVALRAALIGTVGHLRLLAAMLVIYLLPLTVAILTLHRDRLDFAAPLAWAFLAIVALLLILALRAIFRLPLGERGLNGDLLGLIGVMSGLWGLALFIWPAGPLPLIWPWPQDPLTSRLIAAMFLTVAGACQIAEGPAERRSALLLCLIYGNGITAATSLALSAGKPASLAYLIFWAFVALAALYGLLTERGSAPGPGPNLQG